MIKRLIFLRKLKKRYSTLLLLCLVLFSNTTVCAQTGCTDPLAENYNPAATINDGSCTYTNANISPSSSTPLNATLNENSGLILWDNELWTHNDGGNSTDIYNIDVTDLANFTTTNLTGLTNIDWEDIAQDENYIYIGDFGNNASGDRTDLVIYKIEKNSLQAENPIIDEINFSYEDQTIPATPLASNTTNFDCEAMIVTDTGIYLFTKEWTSQQTTVYSLPKTPGTHSAVNQGSYDVNGLITGATYVDGKQLVVLSGYSDILQPFVYLLYDFTGNNFFNGNKRKVNLNLPFHQVEGITSEDGVNYYASNERFASFITIQAQIHKINLTPYLFKYLEYVTSGNSLNFSDPSAWLGGIVPPNGVNIIINHELVQDQDYIANSVKINSNYTINENYSLQTQDLEIQNNPTFDLQDISSQLTVTGNANFLGACTIISGTSSGLATFNNVSLQNGGVDFGTNSTINGTLTLNAGGFVNTNSPFYGTGSTLIYKTGSPSTTPYQRRSEWSNAGLQGRPHRVIVQDMTHIDVGFDGSRRTIAAEIDGDFTIEAGSAFYMDYAGHNMEAPLIVGGNFLNDGTISLSGANGGDLKVFGNFTNNGNFFFNNRAIFFEGSEVQELNATSELSIPYLLINKSAGEVVLNQDIVINSNSSTGLNLSDQGILNLNGHQLQIGDNTITYVEFFGDASLRGSTDSRILFKSTNTNTGTLKFKNEGFGNYLSEFEMDGTGQISISDTLNILRKFILKNGTFNSNNHLTFKSSDTLTAIIPERTGGNINGDIRVERHYPMGNRAFRYVSSPVTSTAFIRDQWQEGANNQNTTTIENPNPGYGTHITGTSLGDNLGFDATQTGNPSLFTWDNDDAVPNWASIPNTNDTFLVAGKAYALMMRGDRSTDLNSNTATGNSTVLRSWGTPKIGEHTVNTSINDTLFALVGNPYQAQVDLTQVDKTNFGNFFYIWDPTIGDRGGYAAVEINGTDVTVTTTPSTDTEANQFLQVGQAFFIQATADNPSITFQESHKTETTENLATFSVPNYATINLNLYRNGNQMVDGLRISLSEDFDDEVNFEDALKLWNQQEHVAIDKNQQWLMVEKRNFPSAEEAIFFFTGNYQSTTYEFRIQLSQIDTHQVYLHDAYLGESYLLNNDEENTYAFEVDASIPESIDSNRFSLQFEVNPLSNDQFVLPQIRAYPNPVTQGVLHISWPEHLADTEPIQVDLYDVFGRKVHTQTCTSSESVYNINLSHLSTGMYVLKAKQGKEEFTTKILVE